MSKIQNAIEKSASTDSIIRIRITPAERAELIDAADDCHIDGNYIEAWGVADHPWRVHATVDPIADLYDAAQRDGLTGARILTYCYGDTSITIRPDGADDCSGDARVWTEDGRIFLSEGECCVPFEGSLQDIVDAWDHA